MNILHLDASARDNGSHSRKLSKYLVRRLTEGTEHQPVYRDLCKPAIPYVDAVTSEAFFTPAEQRTDEQRSSLEFSDGLVEELLACDLLILGTPMYNFTVPAPLKSYLDQVIRPGRTFRKVADGQLEGLCRSTRAIVCTSSGGKFSDTSMDHLRPYLRSALGFIGINELEFIDLERTNQAEDLQAASLASAYEAADRIADEMCSE